jgi:hypothetical protein
MSFRRVLSSLFILALATLDLPACGHQVTPEAFTSILSGSMVIRFRTKNVMDFTNVKYAIVFDTCIPGSEPYPNAFATGYTNYSYAFVVGGSGAVALPTLYQYILTSGAITPVSAPLQPQTIQLQLNDNNLGTEFSLTFPRSQLTNPLQQPNGGCSSGTAPSPTWFINFFTIDTNANRVLDSLGLGGSNDSSYSLLVDTTTAFQTPISRPPGSTLPSTPAAQIDGGEIDNYL